MTPWTLFWCILYGIAATLFFITAAVIAVVGARDLKDLLTRSDRAGGRAAGKPQS